MSNLVLTKLTGEWTTKCCVCAKEYENGVGSTPCCGAMQEIIRHTPDKPKSLRHPQLTPIASRCPNCGNKSWEQCQPEGQEPEYRCMTCQWPTVKPKWTRHQLHEIALGNAIAHLRGTIAPEGADLLAALEAERERWETVEETQPNRISVFYMHDNHTFTPLKGSVGEIAQRARELAISSPYGMLCDAILLHGDKEVRRVGGCVHAAKELGSTLKWEAALNADPDAVRLLKQMEKAEGEL